MAKILLNSSSSARLGLAQMLALVALISLLRLPATDAACPAANLDSCLPAAAADITPSTECCSNLATYTSDGSTNLACLCEAAMGSAFFTTNSVNYAILIPQKCNLKYAAGTECSGVVIPGGQ